MPEMRDAAHADFGCEGSVMRPVHIIAIAGTLVLAGCGRAPRDGGFSEVQKMVDERAGLTVRWDQGSAEDAEAQRSVEDLLAKELSAESAVQIALFNNPQLQATFEDLGLAQADLIRAGALRNPMLSADVLFFANGPATVEFSLVQNLIDLVALPRRKRLAASALAAAKLRVADAVLGLAQDVRVAFYRLQTATQTLEMRRTVVQASAAAYELAKRLRAAGNTTALDLAQEQDVLEQAKLDLASAEVEVADQRERVNILLGLWGPQSATWQPVARLPDLPADELPLGDLERRAISANLGLAIIREEITSNAQRLGVSRPFAIADETVVGVGATREREGDWGVGPAIALPVPILNQGQGAVAAARSDLRRSQQRYAAEAIAVRAGVRMARARFIAARERVVYLRQVLLPLRQRILAETQKQYNGMLASPFQLILAKQKQIEAGALYVQAAGDYWVARSGLLQILSGGSSPGSTESAGSATLIRSGGQGGH